MTSRRTVLTHALRAAAAACLGLRGGRAALAQEPYPSRPIKLVVPYPPGGSTDVIARLLAEQMALTLKQPVVVDNRPGAAGKIGSTAVAHAAPDGYTLLATNMGPAAMAAAVEARMPYNPVTDFAPISMSASMPLILCVAADSPYHSVKDLIVGARAKPGILNFATTGNGSTGHLVNALFTGATGITVQNVPYKGGPEVVQAIMTGQGAYLILVPSDVMGLVRSGRLRALALVQKKRSPLVPEIPTMIESGGPDVEIDYWNAVLAPAGTPAAIVQTLNDAIGKALQLPSTKARLEGLGMLPHFDTPAQFQAVIAADVAKWTKVAAAAAIKVD
ncbi:MAG TPA: tripartite tricarboxylate transporter substrate binding protein [Burkholderiaceae bacterium]|jgi:tripartite-type tricarboxylate transporter receptor subunit TctC